MVIVYCKPLDEARIRRLLDDVAIPQPILVLRTWRSFVRDVWKSSVIVIVLERLDADTAAELRSLRKEYCRLPFALCTRIIDGDLSHLAHLEFDSLARYTRIEAELLDCVRRALQQTSHYRVVSEVAGEDGQSDWLRAALSKALSRDRPPRSVKAFAALAGASVDKAERSWNAGAATRSGKTLKRAVDSIVLFRYAELARSGRSLGEIARVLAVSPPTLRRMAQRAWAVPLGELSRMPAQRAADLLLSSLGMSREFPEAVSRSGMLNPSSGILTVAL